MVFLGRWERCLKFFCNNVHKLHYPFPVGLPSSHPLVARAGPVFATSLSFFAFKESERNQMLGRAMLSCISVKPPQKTPLPWSSVFLSCLYHNFCSMQVSCWDREQKLYLILVIKTALHYNSAETLNIALF